MEDNDLCTACSGTGLKDNFNLCPVCGGTPSKAAREAMATPTELEDEPVDEPEVEAVPEPDEAPVTVEEDSVVDSKSVK